MKQHGKKSDRTSINKKENEICQYPKDLNPFANSNGTTDNDCPSQNGEKASSVRRQRHKRRRKNSKSGEYPMGNNPFNDTDEMSETPFSTSGQRRKKRKESKTEAYKMEDNSSSDADDMRNKPSDTCGQRHKTKRKESKNEQYQEERSLSNDTDEENSSSFSELTNTSDMWSVSSLEDIQFLMNTAAVEDVNVNTALQGLATNNEKDKRVEGADSGDFKAQSFPSGKEVEVSPDDVLSTNKDNDCASIGLANLSALTAKDFTDVDERQILEEANFMEE